MTAPRQTDPTAPKYKLYAATFKHSAVEHRMFTGKSARIMAGEGWTPVQPSPHPVRLNRPVRAARVFLLPTLSWPAMDKIRFKSFACEKNHKFELARFLRHG